MDRDKVQKLLDEFLVWCEEEDGQAEVTVKGKYNKLINLVRWLGDGKKELTLETLKEYKHHLYIRRLVPGKKKERVLSGVRTDFKSNILPFITWLYKERHLIETDWKKEIHLPNAYKKDSPTQSDETIDKMIHLGCEPGPYDSKWSRARKTEYEEALIFIARTKCRIGAIFNLMQENVNVSTRQFSVLTKGSTKHLVFTEDLVPMMERRCKKGEGKVFDLKRANQQQMNEYLHRGAKKLGLSEKVVKEFTAHTLRHSGASNMMAQGVQMYTIQKALGHESIKTTIDTYGHLDTFAAKAALDMNPQVQKALNTNQRRANIRAVMEMAGLTRMSGTDTKFKEVKNGVIVKFDFTSFSSNK